MSNKLGAAILAKYGGSIGMGKKQMLSGEGTKFSEMDTSGFSAAIMQNLLEQAGVNEAKKK